MINLKRPPEQPSETMVADGNRSPYGYGTCINLEDDQVEGLGIGNMQAGTRVRIVAYGVIERVSIEVEGKSGKSMSIQLTDMEASPAASSSADIANKLYPPKA